MRLVLGLGNEGPEYRFTRHNVGFMVADEIALRCGASFAARGDLGRLAFTASAEYGGERILLAKPRTLMNRSGQAAAALMSKHGIEPPELIVVFDDADLAFSRVRVRPDGGAGGHNGVRSLMDSLGVSNFVRVKLGVLGEDRHRSELADYVLTGFHPDERPAVPSMIQTGADAVEAILRDGVEAAQRAHNGVLG